MKIAVVTSCIAGIAMSTMAAKSLASEILGRGHEVLIEERGGHKVTKSLSAEDIAGADVCILAVAVNIPDRHRFEGKPVLQLPVNKAVMDPKGTVTKALELLK